MKTSRIRNAEAKRTYRGEEEARFLLSLLNEGRTIHVHLRVARIVQDSLREIILALQELGECQPMTRQRLVSGDPTQTEQMRKIEVVNKFLRKYQARPLLRLPSPLGGGIRLAWRRTGAEDLELRAVLIAVELAQEGRIASLKECANPNCKRWLFARFKHQKFCPDRNCKDLFHQNDPAEREARSKQAKENYKYRMRKNIR
jgi:hypothetical protein